MFPRQTRDLPPPNHGRAGGAGPQVSPPAAAQVAGGAASPLRWQVACAFGGLEGRGRPPRCLPPLVACARRVEVWLRRRPRRRGRAWRKRHATGQGGRRRGEKRHACRLCVWMWGLCVPFERGCRGASPAGGVGAGPHTRPAEDGGQAISHLVRPWAAVQWRGACATRCHASILPCGAEVAFVVFAPFVIFSAVLRRCGSGVARRRVCRRRRHHLSIPPPLHPSKGHPRARVGVHSKMGRPRSL